MVLPFLSIFFLSLFVFVLEKRINNNGGDENNHNEGDKKNDKDSHHEEEKKKDKKDRVMTTTFKLNCQSCIDKIQNLVSELEGEMELSLHVWKDLLVVDGVMDDIERLRAMLRGPFEIVSLKKCIDGEKDEKETTTVFKFRLHCERCINLIRIAILTFEGVTKVDVEKDLVIICGAMDVQALTERLEEILQRKEKMVMQNEEEKGPVTTTVFKLRLHCSGCIKKIKKVVSKVKGVTAVSADDMKELVTVTGTMDNIALADYMRQKLRRPVEVVPPNQDKEDEQSNEDGNGDGDGDNNGGGGDKNKKKGGGGDGDSDGDGGDKAEGGGKREASIKLDCMSEGAFGYRYRYHAGFENGFPVGQLHVAQMVKGENLNGKEDKQSNQVGNGNGDGSGSDNDNNGDRGGDNNEKRSDHGVSWIRRTKDIKIIYEDQLGFGDGGGQLLVARMFCRGNLNACSTIRSVVLV